MIKELNKKPERTDTHVDNSQHTNKSPSVWRSDEPNPLPGQRYNQWTVVGDYRKEDISFKDRILARCDCGVQKKVNIGNMVYGLSKSCGHDQYISDPEVIARRKDLYENRIGEVFNGFTLQEFSRDDEDVVLTYTLTCPNGHDHNFECITSPSQKVKSDEFMCWCQLKDPVDRMRKRKDMTLQQIGDRMSRTRERIRQYEVQIKNKEPLKRKRYGRSDKEMMYDNNSFTMLADAYNLSERERYMWIDEILNGRFYEYDEPKRQEFMN